MVDAQFQQYPVSGIFSSSHMLFSKVMLDKESKRVDSTHRKCRKVNIRIEDSYCSQWPLLKCYVVVGWLLFSSSLIQTSTNCYGERV